MADSDPRDADIPTVGAEWTEALAFPGPERIDMHTEGASLAEHAAIPPRATLLPIDTYMSARFGEIAKALAKAQGEIEPAVKSRTNQFRGKYADLTEITEACRHALAKYGIARVHVPRFALDQIWLETMLIHGESEQWILGKMPLPNRVRDDMQKFGSAINYAKRYSLGALVGVVAEDEDDDGAAASSEQNGDQGGGDAGAPPLSRMEEDEIARAKQWQASAMRAIGRFKTGAELLNWEQDAGNGRSLRRLLRVWPDGHKEVMDKLREVNEKLG